MQQLKKKKSSCRNLENSKQVVKNGVVIYEAVGSHQSDRRNRNKSHGTNLSNQPSDVSGGAHKYG